MEDDAGQAQKERLRRAADLLIKTVRMAGNIGFQTFLISDASFTFARRDFQGRLRTADEVHSMSLANLHQEYCSVADTATVLVADAKMFY